MARLPALIIRLQRFLSKTKWQMETFDFQERLWILTISAVVGRRAECFLNI